MMTVAFEVKATFYFLKYSPVSHPIKLNNIMYKTKEYIVTCIRNLLLLQIIIFYYTLFFIFSSE